MSYSHTFVSGEQVDLPVGKVFCVGQNYQDHIKEMGSVTNEQAVIFMKPNTAICTLTQPLVIPKERGECHNEVELSVLIDRPLKNATAQQAMQAICGIGIGLDLTLRDVQKELKRLGRPWERAKSFDASSPLSRFVPTAEFSDIQDLSFSLEVNNTLRQQGNSQYMVRDIVPLICEISEDFTLLPGDVVLTGTPAGVAPLIAGDSLLLTLETHQFETQVC